MKNKSLRHNGLWHRSTNIVPAQIRIVDEFLDNLCPCYWRVLNLNVVNCPYSPAIVEINFYGHTSMQFKETVVWQIPILIRRVSHLKTMKISGEIFVWILEMKSRIRTELLEFVAEESSDVKAC